MTHTAKWWSRRCIGIAKVELMSGKKLSVSVYKVGSSYSLDRVLVNPSNSGSVEQAIDYLGVIHGSVVKEWRWSDLS